MYSCIHIYTYIPHTCSQTYKLTHAPIHTHIHKCLPYIFTAPPPTYEPVHTHIYHRRYSCINTYRNAYTYTCVTYTYK